MNDNYITREIEKEILQAAQYFSVISVTGPRQSGKSTLLRHMFPDYQRVSLKDVHIREFAQNDPVAFLRQTEQGMFIDEVQKVPALLEYIQGIVDENPERKFLLSGSSNFELLRGLSESLPGRAGVFELLPMSLSETAELVADKSLSQLLFDGLYPAVMANKNTGRYFYPSYVRTYLEKDVRDLLNIKDQMLFLRFMKLCAARVGSLFNASEIGAELGVDGKTVTHWMSVLQASYIVMLLPPYFENISKRLIRRPKLYFVDPGLACYLLDIESARQLDRDKMRGAIFENMVVMECIKHRYNQGREGGVFFFRDSNQNEVDILLKQQGNITAVEVKSAMTYNSSFERTISRLSTWIQTPVVRQAIVYSGDYENTAGRVALINYRHLGQFIAQ